MQPSSREMQANGGGGANAGQISLDDLHNGSHAVAGGGGGGGGGDDFFDQMLCSLPAAWADLGEAGSAHKLFGVGLAGKSPEDPAPPPAASDGMQYEPYDESALLASRLRQHQIGGGGGGGMAKQMMLQLNDLNRQHHRHNNVQMMLPTMGRSPAAAGGSGGDGLLLPLTLGNGGSREDIDGSFKSPNPTGGEGLYGGFAGSLQHAAAQAAAQHFQHPRPQQTTSMPAQNYGATACGAAPPPAATAAATGGVAQPPRQRVRARRGQATDPHSIAERLRRERIAERMKALQELVPNANKTDKATMLDEIIDYVKFLQLQVKVLSMSRLGGAAAVAPLVADMSSEGRGASSGPTGNDSLTVTEHQVAKLMEEDMGSAMQYLQGKGLCLMPISLASAISSATCNLRPPSAAVGGGPAAATAVAALGAHQLNNTGRMPGTANAIATGDGPSSPSMSVLTAQSAMPNGGADGDGSQPKDAASVSKP